MHAAGTFQVDVKPSGEPTADFPRYVLTKRWSGDITGTSSGEMLTSTVKENGLRTYVALEQMDVTIAGRHGTFLFRHFASMSIEGAKSATMEVSVIPGSATGELIGLEGTLQITVSGGEHRYDLAYTLPAKR